MTKQISQQFETLTDAELLAVSGQGYGGILTALGGLFVASYRAGYQHGKDAARR